MGSGYRTFTAGEVLTASNVQNYLQDQAVMVFGGTAARSSAIGTANFEEGMLTYLTDVDKLQVYTGAAFADVYPAAATNQGLTLINTTSFSGVATQSINDVFSATYDNYFITMNITSVSSTIMRLRWRVSGADNSTSNYNYQTLSANSTTVAAARALSTDINNIGVNNNSDHGINIVVLTPFATDKTYYNARNTGGVDSNLSDGKFNATTSFTGFTIIPGAGNISGTVQVFGFNK